MQWSFPSLPPPRLPGLPMPRRVLTFHVSLGWALLGSWTGWDPETAVTAAEIGEWEANPSNQSPLPISADINPELPAFRLVLSS